jgi:AcrR family transcriptional regulator
MAEAAGNTRKTQDIAPRERILAAAAELFYRRGIRAVGVDAIAEAAGTNKMTLYRHFASKDELVAEYLRRMAAAANAACHAFETMHPGNPQAQLSDWLAAMAGEVASADERGCPLANAAVELPDKNHPARRVIEEFKQAQRKRITALCRGAGLRDPEMLADELYLLLEGAPVTAQSIGGKDIGARFRKMSEMLIAAHCTRGKH